MLAIKPWMMAAATVGLSWGLARGEETLKVGEMAPKLDVAGFVKGEPVKELAKGNVYIVEFWATWCGPCKATIPHLSELQKKHPQVTVIGVSIWERKPQDVKPFVENMGDKMAYRVAVDRVPNGEDPDQGAMAQTWMEAAGQGGIPTAFIVNAEGVVAWIGHPQGLDKPLAAVLAGTYDIKAEAAKAKARASAESDLQELGAKLQDVLGNGDKAGALKLIDAALAKNEALEEFVGPFKFRLLLEIDAAKAATYGQKLLEGVLADKAEALNEIAWSVVDPEAQHKPTPDLLKVALAVALKADTLAEGKSAAIADTYAKALFDNSQIDKAIEVQERAVKLAEGEEVAELKERLEQYRKAKKDGK